MCTGQDERNDINSIERKEFDVYSTDNLQVSSFQLLKKHNKNEENKKEPLSLTQVLRVLGIHYCKIIKMFFQFLTSPREWT